MKRLVLIDAHAVIHRAWHALPPLTGPDGQPVSAVYGFASILLKMLKDLKPDYVAAAFDHEGPTFRHLAYERYKAERVKAPPALYQQIPMVKDLVKAFGIPITEKRGYEADDVIGTIAGLVRRQHPDTEIIIVTGDLDTLQLVDRRTRVFTMRRGVTDTVLYDEAAVIERYGLSPAQLIDFKGLAGDPSDNIPGVKGVGAKTASALLKRYGSIEKIYQALKKSKLTAKPSAIEALRRHEADALFSKTLVTIDRNVPIKFVLASARLRKSLVQEKVRPALEKLGFSSLLRRLGGQEADATSVPSSSPEFKLSSLRVVAAKTFDAIPRRAASAMLKDPGRALILVAVDSSHVYEVPVAALAGSQARSWLRSRPPSYVFGLKSFLAMGLAFDLAARVRDLAIMWWLLEPGRRSYEPEVLIRRELRGVIAHTPLESVALLKRLIPILEKRLRDEDLLKVYEELESPLTPLLYQMEKRGIRFHAAHLKKLSAGMARELQGLEKKIHGAAGEPFNINSPRQLSSVLFERLNLAPKGMRKTEKLGVISTRESELTRLRHLHPIIDDILRYREIAKLKSTYVDALPKLVGSDYRIHTTWNQTGTATGRLSSQNPNLQNIPIRSEYGREIRSAFVAEKGFSLVACDYSQLELRIAADLARDPKMIEAFRHGLDIHRLTAAEINNLSLADVTPELRYQAKALNFGILYGMGARAFAESAQISREAAEHFIEEYFHDFQGVARFLEETRDFVRANGYTKTAFGRKRFFPDIAATNFRLAREAERQAVNHPIQGTEADIMKRAMIAIQHWIDNKGWGKEVRMLLQIHDELIFEIKQSILKEAIPEIRRLMEGAWSGTVSMKVEVKQGPSWGKLE